MQDENKLSTTTPHSLDFTGQHPQYSEAVNSPDLPEGYLLNEFRIISVIGMGAFGITYLAEDTNLNLKVAIKEFFPSSIVVREGKTGTVHVSNLTHAADFLWGKGRFTQEAQTLALFHHPNIVHVFRFFEANGTGYLVMDFEEGDSLDKVLKADKSPWSEDKILEFLKPLLDGVSHVHEAGFLHRDIKPGNIFIRKKDGSPVLLDFGSARAALIHQTQTLTAIVSPGYGPLEQYHDDGTQGAWSDIYAIGAVIYRIISGNAPPTAPSRVKKDSMLPAVYVGNQKYSPAFLQAVDQALNMDEEKRPQTIAVWLPMLHGQVKEVAPEKYESTTSEATTPPSSDKPVREKGKRTYYDILQVSETASIEELTRSYNQLKAKYEGDSTSTIRNEMMFIKHAYDVLSDSVTRTTYDKQLAAFPAVSAKQPIITDEDAVKLYVGKNFEYFEREWEIANQKNTKLTFNTSAFFFGPWWMSYRKMYFFPALFLGYQFLALAIFPSPLTISYTTGISISAWSYVIPLLSYPFFGLFSNYFYKKHVDKNIKGIVDYYQPPKNISELSRQGGTSIYAAIGFTLAMFSVFWISTSMHMMNSAAGEIQKYTTLARISNVSSVIAPVKMTVEMYAQDNEGLIGLGGNSQDNLELLGLKEIGSGLPKEVSEVSVGAEGVITATIAPGVLGKTSCGNITFTPTYLKPFVRWKAATTCPEPAITMVNGFNS